MIEFWLVCVGVLFVLAEFVLWLKDFMLPLPVYILAGAFLAIASNYEGGIISLFRHDNAVTPEVIAQTATIEDTKAIESGIQPSSLPSAVEPEDKESTNDR